MAMLFRPKPPIARQEYDWLVACFAWIRRVLDDSAIKPELVLPDHPALREAKTASNLFEAVRTLMQMQDWPCQLERVDTDFDPGDARIVSQGAAACGTFSIENGVAVIRYASDMLRDPDALAATFAHELCHYLLCNAGDPPGGPELMEHSTDVAAAYCGFGVLLANSARRFEQWQSDGWHGWQSSTQGYLSEGALVTATALFAHLHGRDTRPAEQALKPYLRKDFAKADKAIQRDYPDLAKTLDEVDLLEWAYS